MDSQEDVGWLRHKSDEIRSEYIETGTIKSGYVLRGGWFTEDNGDVVYFAQVRKAEGGFWWVFQIVSKIEES